MNIRLLNERDWEAYCSVRLDSLQDSPEAFGSTYERERRFTEDQWRSRLSRSPGQLYGAVWSAFLDQTPVGLVSAVVQRDNPDRATIYQMWVSPGHRGVGVGSALIRQVQVWATDLTLSSIELSVNVDNTKALSLYETMGFVRTGSTERLRSGSNLLSQPMLLTLQ